MRKVRPLPVQQKLPNQPTSKPANPRPTIKPTQLQTNKPTHSKKPSQGYKKPKPKPEPPENTQPIYNKVPSQTYPDNVA